MAWFSNWFSSKERTDEAIDAFKSPPEREAKIHGEGIQDIGLMAGSYSQTTQSFNVFSKQFLDRSYNNEVEKLKDYRDIACMPEVAEVIEDAANECTQQDDEGDIFKLKIVDDDLDANQNAVKNITDAFEELFHNRININRVIDDWITSYFTDGRIYLENVVNENNKSDGIQKVKKLPAETMDFQYNPRTSKILYYIQYLQPGANSGMLPLTIEEALKDPTKYIVFHEKQITYIDTGKYGRNRKDVIGYLDKVKQPFNQLKLLETSVIIYRIVRAPERFVFNIDVGQMPRDKAMKFVEKVKQSMQKKVAYDPRTGAITNEPEVISMLENFFLPKSSDGKGSSIESIGGNAAGFKEIDDIYYFQRKLYRSLKYPLSRVSAMQERTEKDLMFGGLASGEISQDEIKWGRFLKKQQDNFTDALLDLFLLHLEFTGLKREYDLDRSKLNLTMTIPNNFLASMWQKEKEAKMGNFDKYAQYIEAGYFSVYYLLKNVLCMSDDEIKENVDGFIKDIQLGLKKVDKPEDLPPNIKERLGIESTEQDNALMGGGMGGEDFGSEPVGDTGGAPEEPISTEQPAEEPATEPAPQ